MKMIVLAAAMAAFAGAASAQCSYGTHAQTPILTPPAPTAGT